MTTQSGPWPLSSAFVRIARDLRVWVSAFQKRQLRFVAIGPSMDGSGRRAYFDRRTSNRKGG